MRHALAIVTLLELGCAAGQAVAPASDVAAEPSPQVEAVEPALPPATGAHLVLVQTPCPLECPTFEVSVYETGLVQWFGYDWVSTLGTAQAEIDPELARALTAAWFERDPSLLPKTAGESACAADEPLMSLTMVDAAGVATTRWVGAMYGWHCKQTAGEPDCDAARTMWSKRGLSFDEIEQLDALMQRVIDETPAREWVAPPGCDEHIFGIHTFHAQFRIPDADEENRRVPIQSAVRRYFRHEGQRIRLRGILDDSGVLRREIEFHRKALLAEGIPEADISIETVAPLVGDPMSRSLAGWGRIDVAPARCFGE